VGIFEEAVFVQISGKPTVKTLFHEDDLNWYEGEFAFELQEEERKADSTVGFDCKALKYEHFKLDIRLNCKARKRLREPTLHWLIA
jgi:hypothetical protein